MCAAPFNEYRQQGEMDCIEFFGLPDSSIRPEVRDFFQSQDYPRRPMVLGYISYVPPIHEAVAWYEEHRTKQFVRKWTDHAPNDVAWAVKRGLMSYPKPIDPYEGRLTEDMKDKRALLRAERKGLIKYPCATRFISGFLKYEWGMINS